MRAKATVVDRFPSVPVSSPWCTRPAWSKTWQIHETEDDGEDQVCRDRELQEHQVLSGTRTPFVQLAHRQEQRWQDLTGGERFRRELPLPANVRVLDAILEIKADDEFKVEVNGRAITDGFKLKSIGEAPYCLPIGHALQPGDNTLNFTIRNREDDSGRGGVHNPAAYTYRILAIMVDEARELDAA